MTYVSDCYLPVNSDALLLVNGLKVSDPRLQSWERFREILCADYHVLEYRGFWLFVRRSALGHRDWLRQQLRHTSGCLRIDNGAGNTSEHLWRANPSQDCAVAHHTLKTLSVAQSLPGEPEKSTLLTMSTLWPS